MSRREWNLDNGPLRGLYRDRDNAWVSGVCAGIAEFGDFKIGAVRFLAALSLWLFFLPTAAVYFLAAFLLKDKPLTYSGHDREQEFWRRRDRNSYAGNYREEYRDNYSDNYWSHS